MFLWGKPSTSDNHSSDRVAEKRLGEFANSLAVEGGSHVVHSDGIWDGALRSKFQKAVCVICSVCFRGVVWHIKLGGLGRGIDGINGEGVGVLVVALDVALCFSGQPTNGECHFLGLSGRLVVVITQI